MLCWQWKRKMAKKRMNHEREEEEMLVVKHDFEHRLFYLTLKSTVSLCLLMTLMNWIEWMHWTWLLYDGSLMPGFFLSMFFVLPNHAVDSRGSRRLREMPFFVCLSLSKGNIANLLYIHLLVYWCLFIWSARWSDLEKHLSQWEHLKGLDPVCFLKWRVNSSDRANLHSHPSHEHLYGFSPVHVVVVQMGAIRKTIEKEDRGKI